MLFEKHQQIVPGFLILEFADNAPKAILLELFVHCLVFGKALFKFMFLHFCMSMFFFSYSLFNKQINFSIAFFCFKRLLLFAQLLLLFLDFGFLLMKPLCRMPA